jgi:hypothetical protein
MNDSEADDRTGLVRAEAAALNGAAVVKCTFLYPWHILKAATFLVGWRFLDPGHC